MQANNPDYMISVAYPQMTNYFGFIASACFTIPYTILGIWSGILSGKVNRKVMLGVACILWSLTSVGVGVLPTFGAFCLMRVLLGSVESACNPASYALIADYFPPEYRSTANAIETSGSYVGGGMCGICVILIKKYGWRMMYQIIGSIGVLAGIATILLIKEPKRGVYDLMATATGNDSDNEIEEVDPEKIKEEAKEKAKGAG